jgi:TonB-linked SusC/RagA family outer membrane protein
VYFRLFHDTPPTVMAQYPDGTYGWSRNNHNPLAYAKEWGTIEQTTLNGIVRGKADYEIVEGLAVRTMASANVESWNYDNWRNELQFRDYFTGNVVKSVNTNRLDRRKANEAEYYLQGLIDFNRVFDVHAIAAMIGYDQTQHDEDEIRADREIFYSNQLQEINAGDAARDNNFGNSEAWRLRSGFGRLSYGYDDRYLFEANARYDGSSRFAEGNRFGFFPSFSAAWRISQENFFKVPWINELKIRGSWGEMGNQNIGLYRYFGSVAFGQNYLFGETLANGAAKTNLANRDISWETTEMTDLGLDLELFDSRLSFTGDIYRKLTTGNLISLPIPDIIGLGAPTQNAGSIENRGWEAAVNWRDAFRDGNYAIGFNISDNKNKVLDLQGTGPFIDGFFIREEGLPLGTIWAYEADGLFANQAEIDAHATQNVNTKPGDIRFVDQNGDGVINAADRTVVGNDLPRYTVGSNLSASWKGFDASMFFHGVLKADAYLEGAMIEGPVWENFTTEAWLDRWTPDNLDARMPRPALQVHHNFGDRNSWWVQDASYVKLRNAQLGYTLPTSMTERLNVDRMRIYVSGLNLLTFTAQDLLIDPEFPSGRGVTVHPQTRTISFGTSVGF